MTGADATVRVPGGRNHSHKDRFLQSFLRQLDALPETAFVTDEPDRVAARMVSLLPGSSRADRDIGPFYSTSALVAWLGISRQAINARVKDRALLGLPTADGPFVYPTWQFTDDGNSVPRLAEVLDALAAGTDDRWMWAAWLCARTDGRFRALPAWQWLARGRDPEAVVRAARRDAAVWAR